jgi:O-antigen/teichoic acid export membrane protein
MPAAPGPGLLRGKFQVDLAWNLGRLVVLAVSGVALNVLIFRIHGVEAFGVFQQVWVPYVLLSMLAAGGIDRSVLRAVAAHAHDRISVRAIVSGGVVPTLLLSGATALAFYLARDAIAAYYESPRVALGIEAAAPGLFFFALNKVLLAVVNGLQRMRAYAIYQSARYLGMLAGFFVALALGFPSERVAFVFTFAESLLFVALAIEVSLQARWELSRRALKWSVEHGQFGLKSAVSGMLLELNSRVDVMMIGRYLTDWHAGVYGAAVTVAEGLFQIAIVLQDNYNPLLARHLAAGERDELERLIARGKRRTYLALALVALAAAALYPLGAPIAGNAADFLASWPAFAILMAGIAVAGGYLPFNNLLLMGKQPGWHTLMMSLVVATNVAGNALFIPTFGIAGAAIGTACAFALSALYLRVLARLRLGVAV